MGTDIDRACRILEDHNPKEVAERIGYKSTGTLYSIRSGRINMGKKLASRIVEAYDGKEEQAAKPSGEPKPPRKKSSGKKAPPAKLPREKHARDADTFLAEIRRQEQVDEFGTVARAVISKIVREEVVPALNEKLGRFLDVLKVQGLGDKAAELEAKIKLLEGEIAELRECGKWAEPEEVEAASPIKNIEPDLALVAPETMREDPWVEPWWRRFWRKKKGLFRKEGTD